MTLARLEHDITGEIAHLRQRMAELRPPVEQFGIAQAIRSQIDAFTSRTGVTCTVGISDEGAAALPSDVETAMLRVTQEALANIRKHARASHVLVSLEVDEVDEDLIRLQIVDNGVGFDGTTEPARLVQRGHYDLANLHEWVEMAGGQFSVDSTPGGGTTLTAELALQHDGHVDEPTSPQPR
jgi:signal transduction histidine kinase